MHRYPQNLETALAVEGVVRSNGAIPATIAIINGTVHIGLTEAELAWLAQVGRSAKKCSRHDIATLVGDFPDPSSNQVRGTGATTVAATAFLARLSHPNLRVFVTGGIGGVHRGWESSMDISADLMELGRTDITVICAGAKSILDIPATLEYLETQGVTVIGYQSEYFPSFFTASSGVKLSARADSPKEVARILLFNESEFKLTIIGIINGNRIMQVHSGIVVGVPIDATDEMNSAHIEQAIKQAVKEAEDNNIRGKRISFITVYRLRNYFIMQDITPFLLERVNELTKGDSLVASIRFTVRNIGSFCLI